MKHFISIAAIVSVSISCVQLAKDLTLTESAEELSHEDINTKSTTSVYFWYKNEKIYLSQVENTYFAIFNKGSNTDLEQLTSSHSNDFELKEFNLEHYTDQWNLHGTYGIDIENVHSITKSKSFSKGGNC